MIARRRGDEVFIEDGYLRVTVNKDGSGVILADHDTQQVQLVQPVYLLAARDAGLPITDAMIAQSRSELQAEYFG